MKLGIVFTIFKGRPFEEAMDFCSNLGLEAVEFPVAGYPNSEHFDPKKLLNNSSEINKLRKAVSDRNMIISAIDGHGNVLHPNPEIAKKFQEGQRNAILLAEKLEVELYCGLSGCPGTPGEKRYPNWVGFGWPPQFVELLDWQWKEKIIPFWQDEADFAEKHGVKLCFEMHGGDAVYNPESLLKLRKAVGNIVGANYDPSHLFWQGIDPIAALKSLGNIVYHAHAKDTILNDKAAINGVLDPTPIADWKNRSWQFRTVGYGHDQKFWKDIISAYRTIGYDFVHSLEHEDAMASVDEGVTKAVKFLQQVMLREEPGEVLWV